MIFCKVSFSKPLKDFAFHHSDIHLEVNLMERLSVKHEHGFYFPTSLRIVYQKNSLPVQYYVLPVTEIISFDFIARYLAPPGR